MGPNFNKMISKYEGLRKIEAYGIPHPDWIFVRKAEEIPPKAWAKAPHGWTIRCCPQGVYHFGLPSKHMIEFSSIRTELQSLIDIKTKLNNLFFVIYPSWEFDRSGCCIVSIDRLVIEAVIGDIAPLLRGKKNPDLVYIYEGPYYIRLFSIQGDKKILSAYDLKIIRKSCMKIISEKEVVLEWTKTNENKILFHDWLEII